MLKMISKNDAAISDMSENYSVPMTSFLWDHTICASKKKDVLGRFTLALRLAEVAEWTP